MEVIDEFNDLKIIQRDDLPKYQIDAFLLVDFADTIQKSNSLTFDLGAGTGAVGLLYSQKNAGKIKLIELQPELTELENKSIALNNLQDKVESINANINQLLDIQPINSVDVIITNPPYFDTEAFNKQSESESFAIARSEIKLKLAQLIDVSKKLLKSKGKLFMIHRSSRIAEIIRELSKNGFGIEKLQFVYHDKNSKSDLVLIKAVKQGSLKDIKVLEPKFINE